MQELRIVDDTELIRSGTDVKENGSMSRSEMMSHIMDYAFIPLSKCFEQNPSAFEDACRQAGITPSNGISVLDYLVAVCEDKRAFQNEISDIFQDITVMEKDYTFMCSVCDDIIEIMEHVNGEKEEQPVCVECEAV